MATATRVRSAAPRGPKEHLYHWEGKDKMGRVVRGEVRAAAESVVQANLRKQGVMTTKVK